MILAIMELENVKMEQFRSLKKYTVLRRRCIINILLKKVVKSFNSVVERIYTHFKRMFLDLMKI